MLAPHLHCCLKMRDADSLYERHSLTLRQCIPLLNSLRGLERRCTSLQIVAFECLSHLTWANARTTGMARQAPTPIIGRLMLKLEVEDTCDKRPFFTPRGRPVASFLLPRYGQRRTRRNRRLAPRIEISCTLGLRRPRVQA